jgi:WD40 repeat protein
LRGHLDEVWSLALCPDNRTLVTGSKDGTVCVWDTSTVAQGHGPITLPTAVKTWTFSRDGDSMLTLDHEGQLARWRGPGFQSSQPLADFGTNRSKVVLSPGGSLVATTGGDGAIELWNVDQCQVQQRIHSADGAEEPMAFLAQPDRLVTVHRKSGMMREWDVASGKAIHSWSFGTDGVRPHPAAISSNGKWAVQIDANGDGLLRNLSSNRETMLHFTLQQVDRAAFSPDGSLLAVVNWLGVGQVWNTEESREVATLRGFLQGQHSVAFSPEGDRLAIGSNAREAVKLWDVVSWQELLTLEGQGSLFYAVEFSPGGNFLGASNGQGLLHIWQAPTLEDIERLEARGR